MLHAIEYNPKCNRVNKIHSDYKGMCSFKFSEKRIQNLAPPEIKPGKKYGTRVPPGQGVSRSASVCHLDRDQDVLLRQEDRRQADPDQAGDHSRVVCRRCRRAAAQHARLVAAGKNPAAERRAKLQEATLGALWDSYLDLYAKPRKRSWKDDERIYKKYLGAMKAKRLSAITKAVVTKWHGRVAKEQARFRRTDARRCWRRCFPSRLRSSATPAPTPVSAWRTSPSEAGNGFCCPPKCNPFSLPWPRKMPTGKASSCSASSPAPGGERREDGVVRNRPRQWRLARLGRQDEE